MTCGAVFQSRAAPNKGCSKSLAEFRRRSGERKSNHFLRRHVRRRKYRSACKRAHRPPKADGACAAAGRKPFRQKSTTFLTKTTPQAIACGVASAYPRSIASEAGLAPSGSPAALSHNSAATDSLQNSDNPAGDCLRGCLSMTLQAQRSVFLNWDAGELRLRQITPTALPFSRQTAS